MALLEVKDLKVNYGLIQAIKGISFTVEDGETREIIGHPVTFFDTRCVKAKQFGFRMDLENGETAIVASSSGNGDDRLEAALEKLYHQLMRHMDDLKLAPALRTMIDSFMNQPDEKE